MLRELRSVLIPSAHLSTLLSLVLVLVSLSMSRSLPANELDILSLLDPNEQFESESGAKRVVPKSVFNVPIKSDFAPCPSGAQRVTANGPCRLAVPQVKWDDQFILNLWTNSQRQTQPTPTRRPTTHRRRKTTTTTPPPPSTTKYDEVPTYIIEEDNDSGGSINPVYIKPNQPNEHSSNTNNGTLSLTSSASFPIVQTVEDPYKVSNLTKNQNQSESSPILEEKKVLKHDITTIRAIADENSTTGDEESLLVIDSSTNNENSDIIFPTEDIIVENSSNPSESENLTQEDLTVANISSENDNVDKDAENSTKINNLTTSLGESTTFPFNEIEKTTVMNSPTDSEINKEDSTLSLNNEGTTLPIKSNYDVNFQTLPLVNEKLTTPEASFDRITFPNSQIFTPVSMPAFYGDFLMGLNGPHLTSPPPSSSNSHFNFPNHFQNNYENRRAELEQRQRDWNWS